MPDQKKKVKKIEEVKTEEGAKVKTETKAEVEIEETPVDEIMEEAIEEKIPASKAKTIGPDDFRVGDTVRIFYKIVEGGKLRTQPYEGIVISKRGEGMSKSFTVRRIGADGVGIERIFPTFSPNIDSIKLIKQGKVRRAKLYYLRKKLGRAAMRIKETK
jgi:large subunit ribosomal protein L19